MVCRRMVIGVAITVAAAVLIVACRQIIGLPDNESEPSSTECALPYGTNACSSCVQASCCTESTACAADPACAAYEGCLGNCSGDPSCRAQCEIDNNPGFTATGIPALAACLASKCETACGLACGAYGAGLAGVPDAGAACQSCIEGRSGVCGQAQACASSADCEAYGYCAHACSTYDCIQACASTHDAGVALFAPLFQAFSRTCSTACAYGRNWSCVGHVNWPVPQSPTVAMTAFVGTGAAEAPVSGAEVSVSQYCPPSAEAGEPILQQGQTDDAGTVEFLVRSQGANGPGGGHGLDGCITVTSAGFLPTFWYWGFPLTEPAVGWTPASTGVSSTGIFVPLISAETATLLNMAAGIGAPDLTRGTVGVTVFDCDLIGAPDVQVAPGIDNQDIHELYGLSASATLKATDTTAQAFFVNVPVGPLTLTATPNAIGKPSSVVTVNVQANTFTEVLMYPTP